jgi:hypothetical protein
LDPSSLVVVALQPEIFTLLMNTLTPLAVVDPEVLLLEPSPLRSNTQAYAPRYNENDPPYELPLVVVALESELFTLLMKTLTPLAVVNPEVLLLPPPLFSSKFALQAYAPRYNENDPPYELDPYCVALDTLHEVKDAVSTRTLELRTAVSPTAATATPLTFKDEE